MPCQPDPVDNASRPRLPDGTISEALLAWYDVHQRTLPWRVRGPDTPDPYRVWLSEIMLQQTTVAAVKPYYAAFLAAWPTVEALAEADEAAVLGAWAGLGYYARARNLIACARAVANDHGGRFPDEEAALRTLPGLGRYTAAAVAAIAFGRRAVVVDGNVERVVARLFAVETPLPGARARLHALADTITPPAASPSRTAPARTGSVRAGDFAQAMMDLGATICTPRRPACAICPLREQCAAVRTGAPDRFPVKAARRERPVRRGTAFWLEREDKVLLVRRPAKGLLGGMAALPTGPWVEDDPGLAEAPAPLAWREAGRLRHVFTHFALDLRVVRAIGDALDEADAAALAGDWCPVADMAEAGLPTLFARAAAVARGIAA